MRSAKKYISMLKSWALPMWAFPHRHTTIWHKILSSALVTTSTLYIPTLDSNTKTSKSSISWRLLRVLWAWVRHIPIVAWLNHHFRLAACWFQHVPFQAIQNSHCSFGIIVPSFGGQILSFHWVQPEIWLVRSQGILTHVHFYRLLQHPIPVRPYLWCWFLFVWNPISIEIPRTVWKCWDNPLDIPWFMIIFGGLNTSQNCHLKHPKSWLENN